MSKPNLNTPAIHTSRPLDETDFEHIQGDDSANGLPMPTRTGQIVGGVLVLLSALLVIVVGWHLIVVGWHLIARVLP